MPPAPYWLTRTAAKNLQDIFHYSAAIWGQEKAKDYINDLYQAFITLSNHPNIGRESPVSHHKFRFFPVREHIIFYDVLNGKIVILTILYKMRQLNKILQSMEQTWVDEINRLRE